MRHHVGCPRVQLVVFNLTDNLVCAFSARNHDALHIAHPLRLEIPSRQFQGCTPSGSACKVQQITSCLPRRDGFAFGFNAATKRALGWNKRDNKPEQARNKRVAAFAQDKNKRPGRWSSRAQSASFNFTNNMIRRRGSRMACSCAHRSIRAGRRSSSETDDGNLIRRPLE
jgi:hypothetical protein